VYGYIIYIYIIILAFQHNSDVSLKKKLRNVLSLWTVTFLDTGG